jgi:hypothetical protein
MTDIANDDGPFYLAHVLDLRSRGVPGFAMGEYHDAALAKYVECDATPAAGRATKTRRPGTV